MSAIDPASMGFSDRLNFLLGKRVDLLEPVRNYVIELILYIPNTLVLFGPIVDAINQDFRYTIASLIGIASVFVNGIFSWLYTKIFGTTIATDLGSNFAVGCTVPGFESFESILAPQALVLVNAILGYLTIDFATSENKVQGPLGILWAVLFGAHALAMYQCNCFSNYNFGWLITLFLGVGFGWAFGAIAWVIMKKFYPEKLPSEGFSETFVSGNMIKISKKPDVKDIAKPETCPAIQPSDLEEDEYLVGELYKNGKPVSL